MPWSGHHHETDRHLLHCARDGAGAPGMFLGEVGTNQRIHARIDVAGQPDTM